MIKRRLGCFLIVAVNIMSWVYATSIPFPPLDGLYQKDRGQILQPPQVSFVSRQGVESMGKAQKIEEAYKGLNRLGSRPPNCEHKCRGCTPCSAIQVPTTSGHLGVQYANYEPEGWKCKCGSSFFNP